MDTDPRRIEEVQNRFPSAQMFNEIEALFRTPGLDAVIVATPLDMPPRQPDSWWQEAGIDFPDLRYIMLHVITETSVHAGHLDAVRELIDGRQWIVL